MRFSGTRRARGIILILSLLLIPVLWRVGQRYFERIVQGVGPALLAQAQESLGREVRAERLEVRRPGYVLIEGLRVARGRRLADGVLLRARKAELFYNPALAAWSTLVSGPGSLSTRARLQAFDIRVYHPDGEVLAAETVSTAFDLGPVLRRDRRGSTDLLATIDRVDLGQPRLRLVRRRNGKWNLEDLVRPDPRRKPPAFRGVVYASACRLDLTDYRALSLPLPARNTGTFDLALRLGRFPVVQFDASGRVDGPRGGPLRLQGHAGAPGGDWFLTVNARSGELPYWHRYFARPDPDLRIFSAAGSVSAVVWSAGGKAPAPRFDLGLDLVRGAAKLAALPLPIRDFRGRITVNQRLVGIDGTAAMGEVRAAVTGVGPTGGEGEARFRITADGFTTAALRRLVPELKLPPELVVPRPARVVLSLRGEPGRWAVTADAGVPEARYRELRLDASRWQVEAAVGGKNTALRVRGAVTAPRLAYRGTEASGLNAAFRLVDGMLEGEGRLTALGGAVEARGWLDLEEPSVRSSAIDRPTGNRSVRSSAVHRASGRSRFYVVGRATDVASGRIPWAELGLGEKDPNAPGKLVLDGREVRLEGPVSARFVLSGDPAAPRASAYLHAGPLVVEEERIDTLSGRVRWAGGTLEIPYATVSGPRLTASISGTVREKGELDLRVEGRGIDLARALAGRFKDPVGGSAFVSAVVTGTLKQPRVEGRFQVYQPAFRDQVADYVEGRILAPDSRHVQVLDLSLIKALTRAVSERLDFTLPEEKDAKWTVEGEVAASGLSVVRALRLAGLSPERIRQERLAGDLGPVRLGLSGPVDAPRVRFRAQSPALTARDLDLGRVTIEGALDMAARRIELSSASAASPLGRAALRGSIQLDPMAKGDRLAEGAAADLTLTVEDIPLAPLLRQYVPELLKSLEVRGSVARVEGRLRGTVETPGLDARVHFGGLVVNGRAVPVSPVEVQWQPGAVLLRGLVARIGSGAVAVPYLAALLDEESRKRPLLERVVGTVEVREVPLAAARQLLEDSPYYETNAARDLREALEGWRVPLRGAVSMSLSLPNHLEERSPPDTAAGVPAFFRERRGPAELAATLLVPELILVREEGPGSAGVPPASSSLPAPSSAPARLTSALFYDGNRLDLTQFRLEREGTLLSVSGYSLDRPQDDGRMEFTAEVTGLRLPSLARIPIRELQERLAELQPLDGEARLTAEITGTRKAPDARFSLTVERPVLWGLPFEELTLRQGGYSARDNLLTLGLARLTRKGAGAVPAGEVLASGWLPLAWPGLKLLPDADRSLTVEVPEQSLEVLRALAGDADRLSLNAGTAARRIRSVTDVLARVAVEEGRMGGRFTLGGSLRNPRNEGRLAFTSAALRVENLETGVRDFAAELSLRDNLLSVDRFDGRGTEGGSFTGRGTIALGEKTGDLPRLDLQLAVDKFRFVEKKVANLVGKEFRGSRFEGTFQTVHPQRLEETRALWIRGDWPSPRVSGTVVLDNASLVAAFARLPAREELDLPVFPVLDVDLRTGRSVWLSNPWVRMKLEGVLHAGSTMEEPPRPTVSGRLEVPRGTFTLPGLRLRNVEGYLQVDYDPAKQELAGTDVTPVYVDLTARTSLPAQRGSALESDYVDAIVRIQGRPGAKSADGSRPAGVTTSALAVGQEGGLNVTVRTDPPLPGSRIEAAIRQQFGVEGFGGSGNNVVEALGGADRAGARGECRDHSHRADRERRSVRAGPGYLLDRPGNRSPTAPATGAAAVWESVRDGYPGIQYGGAKSAELRVVLSTHAAVPDRVPAGRAPGPEAVLL